MARSDYILIESPKVKRTVKRLKQYYPYSARFYEALENGTLRFVTVARFASHPRLGPFSITDESAEETFTVFDHPTITIYKKI